MTEVEIKKRKIIKTAFEEFSEKTPMNYSSDSKGQGWPWLDRCYDFCNKKLVEAGEKAIIKPW